MTSLQFDKNVPQLPLNTLKIGKGAKRTGISVQYSAQYSAKAKEKRATTASPWDGINNTMRPELRCSQVLKGKSTELENSWKVGDN